MNFITTKSAASSIVLALAALATLGSASSFAGTQIGTEGEALTPSTFVSVTSRAAVRADYFQAVKSGQIVAMTEGAVLVAPTFMSQRTRDGLHAEAVMAAHHPLNTGTL